MRFRPKNPWVLLIALSAGPLIVRGGEAPAMKVEIGYASRQVFRGVERTGSSAQAAVEFSRDDYSGGVWANHPLDRGGSRQTDLHVARTWQPTTDLTLKAAAAQHWFSGVPGGGVKHTLEAGLTATFAPIHGFTSGLAYYHDFRFRSDTAEVSLARSIALSKWGAFLEINFYAGQVAGADWRPDAPGPRLHDSYAYWGGEARLPYRIGAHTTLTTGLHYAETGGRSSTNGPFGLSAGRVFWLTVGVNLDFEGLSSPGGGFRKCERFGVDRVWRNPSLWPLSAMKTYLARNETKQPAKWHLIDAEGKVLGRLAVKAANILRGRHKPTYTPHVDTGDFVVVINASKVVLTGKKEEHTEYMTFSGYVGGEKYRKLTDVRQQKPEFIIMQAVKGMLPRNRLAAKMLTKLRVFPGATHDHAAQNPVVLK